MIETEVKIIKGFKKGKFTYCTYYRIGTVSLNDVFDNLLSRKLPKKDQYKKFFGVKVKMSSQRFELFKKRGTVCADCGIVGTHFHLERHANCFDRYHFNLYGFDNNGNEIMLSKDHILPKAHGGGNTLSNYQPMCIICNTNKGANYLVGAKVVNKIKMRSIECYESC